VGAEHFASLTTDFATGLREEITFVRRSAATATALGLWNGLATNVRPGQMCAARIRIIIAAERA
jgi:hypothetical protein